MTIKYFYTDGGVHPVAGHVLYRQAQAQDGRDTGRFNRYLCGVLEAVAQRPEDCDRLLSLIGQVERGEQEKLETGGNDVALTLEDGRVQVDILVNEDWIGQAAGNFAFAEWKTALVAWRQFLAMPKGLESAVEIGL
jgi:hypothetical protein